MSLLAENRHARVKYSVLESFEAGIVLTGTEVKSCRAKRVQLRDAFARLDRDEAWLLNCHVSPYEHAGPAFQHEPTRTRKLLLRKGEIRRLLGLVRQKGYTLVPLKLYAKAGRIKVEIGLCRGKEAADRREEIKAREVGREMRRAMRGRG